jgi:hypothetical protein
MRKAWRLRIPRFLLAAGMAALVAGAGVVAAGAANSRQKAKLVFTKEGPGRPTGLTLDINYRNPDDPGGKPPAVRRVVTTLAKGARYDTSVPALCEASNAELMAEGAAACPRRSRVGRGQVRVDTGVPGPGRFVEANIVFLNNTDQLIYVNTVRGTGARSVIRARVTRRRIITNVAPLPGTPPDGGSVDTVHVDDFTITRNHGRRAYIRTPRRCPASGRWTNAVTFTYHDGVKQRVESRSPCRRPNRS